MKYPKYCIKNPKRRTLPAICIHCNRKCQYAPTKLEEQEQLFVTHEDVEKAWKLLLRGKTICTKPLCLDRLKLKARQDGIELEESEIGWGVVELRKTKKVRRQIEEAHRKAEESKITFP